MATPSQSKPSRPPGPHRKSKEVESHIAPLLIVDPMDWSVIEVARLEDEVAARFDTVGELFYSPNPKHVVRVVHSKLDNFLVYGPSSMTAKFPTTHSNRHFHYTADLDEAMLRSVLDKTLESLKEVKHLHIGRLSPSQLIRHVALSLADKANDDTHEPSVEEGWQQLLEAGLRSKVALLNSAAFKTTAEVSELLGIGHPAVRKRIREGKLFALRLPDSGEHRIPAWALDPKVGTAMAALWREAGQVDEWRLYHFLSEPHGGLNGLRPFECLLSNDNLPPSSRAAKEELLAYLSLPMGASLLDEVTQALKNELADGPSA